jgi:2-dehydro-3-deoxyphosphooctonate aldolase (KDO 8-P synthase)
MKINIKNIEISNKSPITIIAGINVFEDLDMAEKVASELKKITSKLDLPFIFKASFDKANRSSVESYRGPGLEEGIKSLMKLRQR